MMGWETLYEGGQESILPLQQEMSICLRYGTKRLERGRNVKADAEEETCPSRYGLNKFGLSKGSFRQDSLVYFQNTQHLCTGWGGHLF